MRIRFIAVVISFLGFADAVMAQHHKESMVKEKGIYEIITSGIASYSFEEKEFVPGNELHLTYWFNHTWGGGFSGTTKFEGEGERLFDLTLLGSWNPTQWMTLNVGPNFALPSDHRDFELLAYMEVEFNYRLTHWFHFGPVIGSLIGKNSEFSPGFHLGFEF